MKNIFLIAMAMLMVFANISELKAQGAGDHFDLTVIHEYTYSYEARTDGGVDLIMYNPNPNMFGDAIDDESGQILNAMSKRQAGAIIGADMAGAVAGAIKGGTAGTVATPIGTVVGATLGGG
jgi:hypothetical protein